MICKHKIITVEALPEHRIEKMCEKCGETIP